MDERAQLVLDRLRARRQLPPGPERRRIRLAADASLRDVAVVMGTSPTSVLRWERGADPGDRAAAYAEVLQELRRIAA